MTHEHVVNTCSKGYRQIQSLQHVVLYGRSDLFHRPVQSGPTVQRLQRLFGCARRACAIVHFKLTLVMSVSTQIDSQALRVRFRDSRPLFFVIAPFLPSSFSYSLRAWKGSRSTGPGKGMSDDESAMNLHDGWWKHDRWSEDDG
jgi:hypothetical protein